MEPLAKDTSQDAVLDIQNLSVHFNTRDGVVQALRGVDLQIPSGRTVGVVGESGCGKSVMSQAILRIIPKPGAIAGGRIMLARRDHGPGASPIDLAGLPERDDTIRGIRGKDIAIIFQEPMTSLSPVYTIGHQIAESVLLHEKVGKAEARRRAIEMLQLVGIPRPEQRVNAYTFELSGGMRQRAMIAMALSCRPNLLIADEPTTALDVTIQAQILELLNQLQREFGMSIMMITHNLGIVAALAHQVAVMYLGRVVEQAPTVELFDHPKHPYTRGLLRSIPRIGAKSGQRLWAIKGMVPNPYAAIQGCTFHPRCPEFKPGLCDRAVPAVTAAAPGHQVSCFLYSGGDSDVHQ
jgi:peptide/nickel transport system ATP-binding protein